MANLLYDLTNDEKEMLRSMSSVQTYSAGDLIVKEGQGNQYFYVIETGQVSIQKNHHSPELSHTLATLGPGDFFGEMSLLTEEPVGATVVATQPTQIWSLQFSTSTGIPEKLKNKILRLVSVKIIDRLKQSNATVTAAHLKRIESDKVKLSISVFLTKTLAGLAFYIFSLPLLSEIKSRLPSDSLISIFYIAAYLGASLLILKQSALRPEEYGVRFDRIFSDVKIGAIQSMPILIVAIIAKLLWVYSQNQHLTLSLLIEPWRAMGPSASAESFSLGLWLAFLIAYVVFSFAQEFVRCAIQGSLSLFFKETGEVDHWKSILIANTVFAALHSHLSPVFALIVFIPGLLWGWLYARHRSFVLVATNHALIGAIAVFVLGIPY